MKQYYCFLGTLFKFLYLISIKYIFSYYIILTQNNYGRTKVIKQYISLYFYNEDIFNNILINLDRRVLNEVIIDN